MKKLINANESAEILGVSTPTIKNWVKHNYIFPVNKNDKTFFEKSQIISLKNKIENGKIERLTRRANKKSSPKKFIPQEYFPEFHDGKELSNISNYIIDNNLSVEIAMFYLTINLLYRENLIFTKDVQRLLNFNGADFKNEYIIKIVNDYYNQLNKFNLNDTYLKFLIFNLPKLYDALGVIYQSVKGEGEKAKQGSYYTPQNIVENIITEHIKTDSTVLDPCCGTGQFLLNINNHKISPENIYGFDIDHIAVHICKINLLIKYKSNRFNPKIFNLNTLTGFDKIEFQTEYKIPKKFDFIFTNPPWGSHYNNKTMVILQGKYPQIKSLESYSYFLLKGISLLKPEGILSYILPESILNIKTHNDIRKIILDKTSILKIEKLGRVFTNVFTNVIRIDLKKTLPKTGSTVKIIGKKIFNINQNRFLSNSGFIFDVEMNEQDYGIIKKVYEKNHITLKNNAEWALGIVTGNNKKFLYKNKSAGCEEIFKGKYINKFHLAEAKDFIKFEPEKFQQTAPEYLYRADEKLIYKFISRKLVFAYDNRQKLTLNSANILIPKILNYPVKVILVLFNSSLYSFIYRKKFNSIKILRSNLEELPLPNFNAEMINKIVCLTDEILSRKSDISDIDNLVFNLFNVSEKNRNYIIESIT